MHLKQCFIRKCITILLVAFILMTAPLTMAAAGSPDEKPVASVAAVGASISPSSLAEESIRTGNVIFITLNEAQWKENAFTSSRDLTTLMKGFVTASQAEQWKLIQSSKDIKVTVNLSTLTLTLPSIPAYDITRDQTVSVTIPKSLIKEGTSDISAGSFTIKCDKAEKTKSLEGAIEDGTLTSDLSSVSPRNILINVPERHVNAISISQRKLGSKYITIVDVTTTDKVASVSVTCASTTHSTSKYISSDNTRKFSVGFTEIQPGADITISAKDGSNNPVQKDITKKVKTGQTIYNELPKPPLHGWYTLYSLITDSKLLDSVLSYYSLSELEIGVR